MLRPIRKVKKCKNKLSVNSQNLPYTILCESRVYPCLFIALLLFSTITKTKFYTYFMALNGLCVLMCLYYIIFLLHNVIYIHYFTNVFPMVIEHFANVLFMFIVNISNNSFSVLLKYFENILCLLG